MQFFDYIEQLQNNNLQHAIFVLHRQSHYGFVWTEVVKMLLDSKGTVFNIDPDSMTPEQFIQQVSVQSLFYAPTTYFLDATTISPVTRKSWIGILKKCPVSLHIAIAHEDTRYFDEYTLIQVPSTINREQALALSNFYPQLLCGIEKVTYVIDALYASKTVYFLEDIWHIFAYISIINVHALNTFVNAWVPQLTKHDTSLFQLSTAFFALQEETFVDLWKEMLDWYQPVFWTTYWSDQVWRAALFVYYMRAKDTARAKEIQHKLPFSFIKYDWQKHSFTQLQNLHTHMSDADYAIKNGGHITQLDTALMRYFY